MAANEVVLGSCISIFTFLRLLQPLLPVMLMPDAATAADSVSANSSTFDREIVLGITVQSASL